MSQFAIPSLDATVDDGVSLTAKFNGAIKALYSNHEGAGQPPSPVDGMLWADNTKQTDATDPHIMLKMREGGAWYQLGKLNLTAGIFTTSGGVQRAGDQMQGQLKLVDGSAAAPGFAFQSSPSSGFFSGNANSIKVAINGVERGHWDGSGLDVFDTITITGTGQSATFRINKQGSGKTSHILGMSNGQRRWDLHVGDDQAESGGDTGSMFKVSPHNDAGGAKMPAFQISRLHQIWFWTGSWSTGMLMNPGASSWSAISDERMKNIVAPITNGVEAINAIKAIRYRFKDEPDTAPVRIGLSAQSVQTLIPEAVAEVDNQGPGVRTHEKTLVLAMTDIIPHLVAAIQELSAEVARLKGAQP
jgi:hypothetical protein